MAETPMPGEGIKEDYKGQSMPTSPTFWGRSPDRTVPAPQAPRGPQKYPMLMYHPNPEQRIALGLRFYQEAKDESEHKKALEMGWLEKPTRDHMELLQHGDGGKSGKRLPHAMSITEDLAPVADEESFGKDDKKKK